MKTLLLLRHAKAESPAAAAKRGHAGDTDRRLVPRGQEDCAKIAAYMKAKDYAPEIILASSAARTAETAERIAPLLGSESETEIHDSLYLASANTLLRHIHALNDGVSSAMFIGHNPGLHELACALASHTPSTDSLRDLKSHFPTCALAVLTFKQPSWALCDVGDGTLVDFTTPRALRGDG